MLLCTDPFDVVEQDYSRAATTDQRSSVGAQQAQRIERHHDRRAGVGEDGHPEGSKPEGRGHEKGDLRHQGDRHVLPDHVERATRVMHEERQAIVIRCREDRQRVVVSVCDSGPGVYAGSEEAVFEPFYTTKAGGMGMGLSIVRSIVEAHGGSISATNANAEGAVIQFSLEAADDTAG